MAQRIKIKRSNSATNPADLKEGELAYIHSDNTAGNLYIGRPGTGDASTGLCSSIDIVGGLIDHTKLSGIDTGAEVNPDQVTESERTAGTETAERSYSPADIKSMVDTHALTGLTAATATALGAIKLHDATAQTTAPENVSTTANRSYSVQLDADSKASVNVPWTDTVYTLPTASSSAIGGIKVNATAASVTPQSLSTTADRSYAIQVDANGVASVNVPWATLSISSSPANGAVTTAISSDWAFDNVKTAVPSGALFTDTTYTGSTGVTVNASDEISIGQAVGTTDDVTFDDLTLTGNIQLDDSGEIKFTSEGLAYDESTNTITSTRIIFDEWVYDDYTANELADIARAILRIANSLETMPAKYTHLFDFNGSNTISSVDVQRFLDRVEEAVSESKFTAVSDAITNATGYYTTLITDLKDGDYDVASVSDGSISLGSSSSRFKNLELSGDATIGGDLDVGGTVSIGDIVTQSSTSPVIKLKDTTTNTSNDGDDFKIAVNTNEIEITQHTDLDEAGDASLSLLKGKANAAGDGVLMAIGGAYDSQFALNVNGGLASTGNFAGLGTVILGSAAVAAIIGTGTEENPEVPAVPAKHTTVRADLIVDGDLTVSGTTTTISTEEILLADNLIELNSNVTGNTALGTGSLNGGISLKRGTGNDSNGVAIYSAELKWNEVLGKWTANQASNIASPLLTTANYESEITELNGGTF